MNRKDLTGKRFNRLIALKPLRLSSFRSVIWLCLCDCGNYSEVRTSYLTNGEAKSCGCLRDELSIERIVNFNKTHGLSKHPLYSSWKAKKQRCNNPNHPKYHRYGERGIKICNEWSLSFKAFLDYVSKLPDYGEDGYTLDRIDNDGNYEPGNVRWASSQTQRANRGGY